MIVDTLSTKQLCFPTCTSLGKRLYMYFTCTSLKGIMLFSLTETALVVYSCERLQLGCYKFLYILHIVKIAATPKTVFDFLKPEVTTWIEIRGVSGLGYQKNAVFVQNVFTESTVIERDRDSTIQQSPFFG